MFGLYSGQGVGFPKSGVDCSRSGSRLRLTDVPDVVLHLSCDLLASKRPEPLANGTATTALLLVKLQ